MKTFIQASRKYGVIPCVKHFPGHGNANKDSHLTLPEIDIPLSEMENVHIKPFKYAIEDNIEMVMVAHLHCTCFDKEEIPTSLSKNAVEYLRNTLNYNGVLITDDMVMKGVSKFGSLQACLMAIDAGVDMFIFRNSDDYTLQLIENLINEVNNNSELRQKVIKSNERILKLKQRSGIL
jgi:beta-N-acetylhexosaminidase